MLALRLKLRRRHPNGLQAAHPNIAATRAFSFLTNQQLRLPVSLRPAILPQNQDRRVNSDDTDILMRLAVMRFALSRQRLHQASFREAAIKGPIGGAVRFLDCRINGCSTPHTSFPEANERLRLPVVPNGLPLSKGIVSNRAERLYRQHSIQSPKKSESPRWR